MKAIRALCLLAATMGCSVAMAHAVVKQSSPPHGARLSVAPAQVTIVFNEKIEPMFSAATLQNGIGATIPTQKASIDPSNPALLRLPMPALAPGPYAVKWSTVGIDGHRRTGKIAFTLN